MRILPLVLLLFTNFGCGSESPSVDEVESTAQGQDVESKSSPATSSDVSLETQTQAIAAIKELGGSVTDIRNKVMSRVRPDRPLWAVDFRRTKITDEGLEHLKGLLNLLTLNLSDTEITGDGLEHLKKMGSLKSLDLGSTKVTDSGLEHLKGVSSLEILNLNYTDITGDGLEHLKEMSSLKNLTLIDTRVTDSGLEHLKGISSLEILGLDDTKVTDEGVKTLNTALPNCNISY